MGYRLTERARRHVGEILDYSLKHHGTAAATRYGLLIQAALDDIGGNALLLASQEVPGQADTRDYELRHSRTRVPASLRVSNPRHKIVYRRAADGDVDILAIVGVSLPSSLGPER